MPFYQLTSLNVSVTVNNMLRIREMTMKQPFAQYDNSTEALSLVLKAIDIYS